MVAEMICVFFITASGLFLLTIWLTARYHPDWWARHIVGEDRPHYD